MTPIEEFRNEVEEAIAALGVSPTCFGKEVAADPGFVFSLRAGREPRYSTIEKVRWRISILLREQGAQGDPGHQPRPLVDSREN